MTSIIGTNPNQVPTNADLGTMAYQDYDVVAPQLLAGRRNLIINGGFDVWQRGTSGSFVGGPKYVSADRWYGYLNTSTTITLSRQAFTNGQTEVPNNPKYYARFDWLGTGSSQFFSITQRIEGVQHGAGGHITLSFYARTEQGDDITVGVNQKFGSGGSSDVNVGNTNINATTSWKKYEITLGVPSISGKTIGTGDNLEIAFYRTGTLNSYLELANVQLELGKVATPFEQRSYGEELTLCSRYYHEIKQFVFNANKGNDTYWDGHARAGSYPFPVPMRASPSVTLVQTFGWLANTSGWTTPSSGRHPVSIGVTNEQNVAFTGSNYWDDPGTGGSAGNTTAVRIEKATVDAEL